jgi:hypothetical protein
MPLLLFFLSETARLNEYLSRWVNDSMNWGGIITRNGQEVKDVERLDGLFFCLIAADAIDSLIWLKKSRPESHEDKGPKS